MDPRKLFFDQRNTGFCVYCGGADATSDHVPSKVLLDKPYPNNLPQVAACDDCNNRFSRDEPYLACLIDCVIRGSVDPNVVGREKIRRILLKRPHFAAQIASGMIKHDDGTLLWQPDLARVRNIAVKLARGHFAYEMGEPQLDEPTNVEVFPLCLLDDESLQRFEASPLARGDFAGWPEIGSRAFLRTIKTGLETYLEDGWRIVQEGRYRYAVSQTPTTVRIVLSEYLGCEVVWD